MSVPWLALAAVVILALPALSLVVRQATEAMRFYRSSRRPQLDSPLEPSWIRGRVGFGDIDPNIHMTNARYLTLVDRGRFDLMMRLGFVRLFFRSGVRPMVGTTVIRYRRGLDLFARYTLHSRFLGWDDKWFYMEHRFELAGRTAVMVVAKFLMVRKGEKLAPVDMLNQMLGPDAVPPSPELPEHARVLLRDSDPMLSPD